MGACRSRVCTAARAAFTRGGGHTARARDQRKSCARSGARQPGKGRWAGARAMGFVQERPQAGVSARFGGGSSLITSATAMRRGRSRAPAGQEPVDVCGGGRGQAQSQRGAAKFRPGREAVGGEASPDVAGASRRPHASLAYSGRDHAGSGRERTAALAQVVAARSPPSPPLASARTSPRPPGRATAGQPTPLADHEYCECAGTLQD